MVETYYPGPESQGGWRALVAPEEVRRCAGMEPHALEELRQWLRESDDRPFAAVVIRNGFIILEEERGRSARTSCQNIKSCAKAICATVLAIAAQESQSGEAPRKMAFGDPASAYLPWAEPLSDPRKAQITVRQLLNHTSGITPERSGVPNRGSWEVILGHAGDGRTATLAFDPGTDLGYTTHAFYHAALVCEYVTGMPYDRFAINALLRPLGIETWWFEVLDGNERHGSHPSHALGLPAREMARIAYCLLHGGRWGERQVIPRWFIEESGAPTHEVQGIKDFGRDAQSFSLGWELPGQRPGGPSSGIPPDARSKPGSGGQLIALVPSLDLVVVRQTGGSGQWPYDEYLSRACAAVLLGHGQ